MGKINKGFKPNNNNKRRENYFDQKIKQFGDDFMAKMNPTDLKKDANRILKDIAYGNINYGDMKYTRYFADPNFIQILLQVSYENWNYNNVTAIGLEMYFKENQVDDSIIQIYDIHDAARNAYYYLYNALNNVMQYLQTCYSQNAQVMSGPIVDIMYIATNNLIQYNKGMNYTFVVVVENNRRQQVNDQRACNTNQGENQKYPVYDNG